MGFSFKNLFKKDEPQEDTEHVSLGQHRTNNAPLP